jgi:hypothetical protein
MTIYVASRSICSVLCNGTQNVDNEISGMMYNRNIVESGVKHHKLNQANQQRILR